MDFSMSSFRNLASEAQTALSRAVQFTEEKLGQFTEKTEYDEPFVQLMERSDRTKYWTETLVSRMEATLQPNPSVRLEEYVTEKFTGAEKGKQQRLRNIEWLGNDMIDAGVEYGPDGAYGSQLIKFGQLQQRLGQVEREFVTNAYSSFVLPLRKFLDDDMRTITKERRILEQKRLDLDAAKNRVRKAKTLETQANPKTKLRPDQIAKEVDEAEIELTRCQEEFDRQVEITRLLLEGISSAHVNHVRCLNDFMETQVAYYNKCHAIMSEPPAPGSSSTAATATTNNNRQPNPSGASKLSESIFASSLDQKKGPITRKDSKGGMYARTQELVAVQSQSSPDGDPPTGPAKRARVLYDYDPAAPGELRLKANEIILVFPPANPDEGTDYMIGEKESKRGKVPVAYLEILP